MDLERFQLRSTNHFSDSGKLKNARKVQSFVGGYKNHISLSVENNTSEVALVVSINFFAKILSETLAPW